MDASARTGSLEREARNRSPPPGTWRLFGPALLAWGCAAVAILHPGSGRVLAVAAGASGALLLVLAWAPRETALRRAARLGLRHGAIACAVLLLLGASIEGAERVRSDPGLARAAEQQRSLELDVVLRGFPQVRASSGDPRAWAEAGVRTPGGEVPVVLWLSGEETDSVSAESWAPGTRLQVRGGPVELEAGSAAAYGVRVERAEAAPDGGGAAGWVAGAGRVAASLRAQLREAAAAVPGAELVPGFAVGDTALVDESLERRMQQSSLLHLVAVSGANCALVTGAIVRFSAVLGVGRRLRIVLAGAALGAFVFVVGPDASVQRAALMAAVVLVSGFGGKRAVALPALGAAVIALLLLDPWQALQPGFALSVAATAGILLLVPGIERGLSRLLPLPRWLVLPVAVALAAQLACGPLLVLLQPGIPAVGILANVLAAPAAPLGTGLGLMALLLLPASEALGGAATVLAGLPARWVAATAEVSAQLPLARWPWPEGWPGALLLAAVQAAALVSWWIASRRIRLREDRGSGRLPWRGRRPLSARGRAIAAVLLCAAAGAFAGPTVVAPLVSGADAPRDWSVVACDVGQGDAILLRDPARPERVALVDTGDDAELLRACLDRFGVRSIALLVLTHDDRDHAGALGAAADAAEAALVAPDNSEDGADRPVLAQLDAAGIPYRAVTAGMTGAEGGLSWEALAPAPDRTPADTNAASVVLLVRAGELPVLMLGDTGEEEQRALRAAGTAVRASVAKVAHHGSRDQDPALAEAVGAEVALVSVGVGNGYGHPTAEALDAYVAAGSRPLRTDRHGSIAIAGAPGSLRIWVERAAGPVPGSQ
ncbi:ComEC/Rec2 family competence protein [Leucobacter sp. wl10]|uniref:ComEC/Rec2 family competence protein n=1 Tax=Leucobacter sp. wl10 TaxID=2304677 RepID=UPI0019699180|nr:ComEC/Rec2 family competence protein [Leucobacter sp. wl10]